jgi:hypothetical protein
MGKLDTLPQNSAEKERKKSVKNGGKFGEKRLKIWLEIISFMCTCWKDTWADS